MDDRADSAELQVVISRHRAVWKECPGVGGRFPAADPPRHARRAREAHGFLAAEEIISTCDTMAGFVERSGQMKWDDLVAGMKRFTFPERFQQELDGMLSGIREALVDPAQRIVPTLKRAVGFGRP